LPYSALTPPDTIGFQEKNKNNKNPCSMLRSAFTVFGGWWVEVVVLKINFIVQLWPKLNKNVGVVHISRDTLKHLPRARGLTKLPALFGAQIPKTTSESLS
jgi:hypothetical protein